MNHPQFIGEKYAVIGVLHGVEHMLHDSPFKFGAKFSLVRQTEWLQTNRYRAGVVLPNSLSKRYLHRLYFEMRDNNLLGYFLSSL